MMEIVREPTLFVLQVGVGDDDPKVDGLLGSELFVVPAAFDPHVAVLVEGHPRRVAADRERFRVCRLLQLKHELAFWLAVPFTELDAFGRPLGAPLTVGRSRPTISSEKLRDLSLIQKTCGSIRHCLRNVVEYS